MSGTNVSILNIPPGMSSDSTAYSTGKRWRYGSLVRWLNDILTPIGGWVTVDTLTVHTAPVRDVYSWRDYLKVPWVAAGSEDKLTASKVVGQIYTNYDITPTGLVSSGAPKTGYGSGGYGSGAYSQSNPYVPDSTGQWSMDNFGRELLTTHTQDGRLFSWDPLTFATPAVPVTGAPIDNSLVVVTEEEHVMLFGGKQNSRRVQWSSQRNKNDWTATETNSAGGFELKSNGSIKAVKKVQGGILVLTDSDTHIIEYSGPPDYYTRRRISEDGGIIGKNSIASIPGGAVWISQSNFWIFDGNINKMDCSLHTEVFYKSNLTDPSRVFMGVNEYAQEVWLFYPGTGGAEPNRYAFFSYAKDVYWSGGNLTRQAWLNPVWQARPYMIKVNVVYEHERGWTDDGATRAVFAVTGGMELGEGDTNMWVDRIWPDALEPDPTVLSPAPQIPTLPLSYTLTFGLQQAPGAPVRTYGPVSFNSPKGYTSVRFRARQLTVRVDQTVDGKWTLGKLRVRLKKGGIR
jgi:hypothetical protein